MVKLKYIKDVEEILSHRFDNGADYWTTPDKRLLKGTPFSAFGSALMLLELGMKPSDPILMGYTSDVRIQKTFQHFFETQ